MPEPISAADGWFDLWFDAFADGSGSGSAASGGSDHGIWTSATGTPRVPYVRGTERIGGAPVHVVRSATNVHTPRFDVLGAAASGAGFCRGLLRDLDASMLVVDYVAADARLLASLADAPVTLRWHRQLTARSPIVDCTLDFQRWWADRGSHKETWARRERRLIDRDGAQFRVLRTWAEAEPVIDEIFEVEASGWKGSQGTAIRQHTDTARFYRELIRWCAENETLRLYVLSIDDRIIAFQLDALFDGVLSMFKIGFRDEHRKTSPGQVLQLQILRAAFEDPDVAVFDMLGGSPDPDETKMRFATGVEDLYRIRVFAPTPRGALAWSRHVAAPAVRSTLEPRLRAWRDRR